MTDSEKLDLILGKAQSMDEGRQRMKSDMQGPADGRRESGGRCAGPRNFA